MRWLGLGPKTSGNETGQLNRSNGFRERASGPSATARDGSDEAVAPGKLLEKQVRLLDRKICFVSCWKCWKKHWCRFKTCYSHSLTKVENCYRLFSSKEAIVHQRRGTVTA